MKKSWWALWLFFIILLGIFLRLWQLGKIPQGFYSDEALYGYEAYSLLKTGKDQFGNFLPLSIAGFGDYRPGFYIYATIPFVAIFGLTEVTTRLPSAVYSIATLIIIYFFVLEIFKNKKIALFSTILLAVSPWSLFYARMAHETNLQTLLLLFGSYFLFLVRRKNWAIFPAVICFTFTLYTYHSARIFVPLFLFFSFFIFRQDWRVKLKNILLSMLLFGVLLLPLFLEFTGSGAWSRINGIGFWNDQGAILKINETRGAVASMGIGEALSRIIVNKITVYPLIFLANYIKIFSPDFLLIHGDQNGIYNNPNNGILLWIEPLLVIAGFIYLWKKNQKIFWWLLAAILISFIPDALTKTGPSSARIHLALPYVITISGVGLWVFVQKYKFISWGLVILIAVNCFWWWKNYLFVLPVEHESTWQVGTKEMIFKTNQLAPNYQKIWMSRSCWGWIHVVFHLKYNPSVLQKEIKVSEKNEYGFWWVSDVGKYHLEWLPKNFTGEKKTLFIAYPEEFPSNSKPIDKIIDPYGKEIFWFVDGRQLDGIK